MNPDLTTEESQFLTNTLAGIQQNSLGLTTPPPQEMDMISEIILKIIFKDDFTAQEIGYLQTVMQIQSEIWGRQSSTANEKLPVTLASFVPQHTRVLIKSISTKLGASIIVDVDERSIPNSPRKEGSRSIVVDPTLIK